MSVPENCRYTKSHEWVRVESDEIVIGITDFAQREMGDIVYADLPKTGQRIEKGSECGVVESVKAASDIYAPVSGTVIRINEALQSDASVINRDPYGQGWFYAVKTDNTEQIDALMDSSQYAALIEDKE